MRNACLLSLVLIGLGAASVHADDEMLWESGNAFVRFCSVIDKPSNNQAEVAQGAVCATYVRGLSDCIALEAAFLSAEDKTNAGKPYCSQETSGVEEGQKVRILLKYIRNNPEKAHLPAPILFTYAMREAFPACPKQQ